MGETGKAEQPIDPARSACVLIGVDAYTELAPLRGVAKNLVELGQVLKDETIWGIAPERLRMVSNPHSQADLVGPIREMADLAQDALIVYYSGHGLVGPGDDQLYLTLPGSVHGRPETAVPFAWVRDAVRDSDAKCRVVVLDCCYSGKVLDGMGMSAAGLDVATSVIDVQGSYLMTSAAQNRKSLAAGSDRCTVFTGEFVDVLRAGVADGPEALTFSVLFKAVRTRLINKKQPEPQEQDRNGVGGRPFARNLALAPPPPQPALPVRSPRRTAVGITLVAVAVALAFAAGWAVHPGEHWWRGSTVRQAGGACSPNATLLSYSDALNKKEAEGESVSGLSALALTGPSKMYALQDNWPGRVFPITLRGPSDAPGKLAPQAGTAKTLRDPSGAPYASGAWDGEGMVMENGGRTMLVSSEVGPVIQRFDMATGRTVGRPLPIPRPFMTRGRGGDSEAGRTLESLAATPDGRYLYAGMEGPLSSDRDDRGRYLLRIQRYKGTPGGSYTPDRQYAIQTGAGLYLAELAVVGDDQLLALERNYTEGLGNAVQIFTVSLNGATDVTDNSPLYNAPADHFAATPSSPLVDLASCPAGSPGVVDVRQKQSNPLLDNVEGMAVSEPRRSGKYAGWRTLYLVSDDNNNYQQITRLYELRIKVPAA